ncbi:hypothetical protein N7510_006919 [Penicillium lagena]|uniref:uncharacterized protein n=1 Tax=Penicillium lagena TaxID=94218 RepID=UPI002541FCAA|nr:uncharacterized protein N7510_006919 [Penicillium lagena]KAJ5610200.1 hypothetical protein N7510_006919 [Penicillium lagena]
MAGIEISFSTIKPVLIFFGPVIITRLLNAYRTLRVSVSTRPPPRPLPAAPGRALNILFGSIVLFLLLSLPFNPHAPGPNVFAATRSRINTPTNVIFDRLARLQFNGKLSDFDALLQTKFTSNDARKIYLTYGPDALASCQYCTLDNQVTYLLYYIPFNVLLPHLVHLLILGVATSAPFAGQESARWRNKFTITGLALFLFDLYAVYSYDPMQAASAAVRAGVSPPASFYNKVTLLRPLVFAVCDSICASIIWLSATHRFFFKPPSQPEQVDNAITAALAALTNANSKLHGSNVTRNAVVRDKALKTRDDAYWQTIVSMENPARAPGEGNGGMTIDNIWEEEEVARAVSRTMAGQGGVDVAQLGVKANEFVRDITEGLDG